ncbi:MAG TPA: helix-turn-helix transcriptional regulator [Bryobacteraceae bacterium]|nr:helix-turn-helix transcriptional regulator [Bryobacteraceae bacterium]
MNTISKIAEKLKEIGYRKAFIASQINIGIPFQIRALMKARGWTQDTLAEKTGMLQPRISGLMKPGKTRPNIETLRRVAEAFDCALIVRFAPFSELAKWAEEFEPDSFNVPSFTDDVGFIEHKPAASAMGIATLLCRPEAVGAISIAATGAATTLMPASHNNQSVPLLVHNAPPQPAATTAPHILVQRGLSTWR